MFNTKTEEAPAIVAVPGNLINNNKTASCKLPPMLAFIGVVLAFVGRTVPIGGLALGARVTGFAFQFSQTRGLLIFGVLWVVFVVGTSVAYFSDEAVLRRPEALRALRPRVASPVPACREFVASG